MANVPTQRGADASPPGRLGPFLCLLRGVGHLLSHLAVQSTGNGRSEGTAGVIALSFWDLTQDAPHPVLCFHSPAAVDVNYERD